ncbi:MAG TPA: hypothetical protein DDY98_03980 [Ruminococcaceae bacterium]|nr:hypothetical protein [Oscillospiraceae bacterium]
MRKEAEQKAIAILQREEAFAAATKQELTELIHHETTVLREFKKGQAVLPAYGISHSFGLLLSGGCLAETGRRIVGKAQSGDVFALDKLFSPQKETALRLVAEEDGKVLFVSKTAVEELMRKNFAVTQSFLQMLSAKIDTLNGTVVAAKSTSAEEKLAHFLLEHKKAQSNELALSPDLGKLAKQVGIGKDALNRSLDRLHTAGAIGFRGRTLVIENMERLQNFQTKGEDSE